MNQQRRRCLKVLPGAALAALLPACAADQRKPLVIASHVWPGYDLMFLARDEGWLPPTGLLLRETASATESLAALTTQGIDGAALTLDEVLRARAAGIPLTIILIFDASAGADAVLARAQIRHPADLAGKRIGVEQTAVGALVLHYLLATAGLSARDVTQVPLNPAGHLETWRRERLDAIVTYEPITTRLTAEGAHLLFDSREMPDAIFDVLAVRTDALGQHDKALAGLVAGHFRALRHLQQHPQDAAFRLATRMGLPAADVLGTYRGLELPDARSNRRLLTADAGRLVAAARNVSQVMVKAGLLARDDSLADLVDADFLPRED